MSGAHPLNEITTFERRARRDRRACWGSSLRPPRSLRWTSYFWAAHREHRAKTLGRWPRWLTSKLRRDLF